MWAAILCGHWSTIELLLNHDNGLLEIASEPYGGTPLMVAILSREWEIVHRLLDRGANALVTSKEGFPTLLYACQSGANLATVRQLLAAGLDVKPGNCAAVAGRWS